MANTRIFPPPAPLPPTMPAWASGIGTSNPWLQQQYGNQLAQYGAMQNPFTPETDEQRAKTEAIWKRHVYEGELAAYEQRLDQETFKLLGMMVQNKEDGEEYDAGKISQRAKDAAEAALGLLGKGRPQCP